MYFCFGGNWIQILLYVHVHVTPKINQKNKHLIYLENEDNGYDLLNCDVFNFVTKILKQVWKQLYKFLITL